MYGLYYLLLLQRLLTVLKLPKVLKLPEVFKLPRSLQLKLLSIFIALGVQYALRFSAFFCVRDLL